jgi:ABC-2 type transport system permease protein
MSRAEAADTSATAERGTTAEPDTATAGGGAAGLAPPRTGSPDRQAGFWWTLGFFRSELLTTFRRWRTLALLAVLAAVPVLVGIAVKIETSGGGDAGGPRGGGPAFLTQVTNNGLFLVFAALAATLPVFLPMTVGVIAGDSVAGESAAGTLRYLLVVPAGRTRLLLAKYASTLTFCLTATLVVAAFALATGAALFPVGDVTPSPARRSRSARGCCGRCSSRYWWQRHWWGSRRSGCSSRP